MRFSRYHRRSGGGGYGYDDDDDEDERMDGTDPKNEKSGVKALGIVGKGVFFDSFEMFVGSIFRK